MDDYSLFGDGDGVELALPFGLAQLLLGGRLIVRGTTLAFGSVGRKGRGEGRKHDLPWRCVAVVRMVGSVTVNRVDWLAVPSPPRGRVGVRREREEAACAPRFVE